MCLHIVLIPPLRGIIARKIELVNAVSLAKLLVKPFMAKFTAFDDSFDTSAALAVLSYEGLFPHNVTKSSDDVNSNVRAEWAHPDYSGGKSMVC